MMASTDSATTEGIHSENKRRGNLSLRSHDQELEIVSAWFMGRQRSKGPQAALPRRDAARPTTPARGAPQTRAQATRRYSWAWRAFQRIQGGGKELGREYGAELSALYARLSPAEREFYIEVGEVARLGY